MVDEVTAKWLRLGLGGFYFVIARLGFIRLGLATFYMITAKLGCIRIR